MAKSDRTGRRKTRDQRDVRRIPELGYYYIVTDTEATERCYFNGFRNSLMQRSGCLCTTLRGSMDRIRSRSS